VVFPRHVDEILATLAACHELKTPLTARGGGTSIAGNALSTGVVLDYSRHLNKVLSVDPEQRTAAVEPGTILDDITAAGKPHGLRFGPDPSTHARATIGGAIGNNSCGSRALRYGRTSDNVRQLDVVTGEGTRFTAARGDGPAPLRDLAGKNLAMIRTEFGRFTRQVSGYSLEHLLPENGFDVASFLVGTEGTLALTLGATVRLVESPQATALAVLGYPDMAAAAAAVPGLLPHAPVALEGLDSRLVDVVRTRRGPSAVPQLPRGGGWIFAETTGGSSTEARAAAEAMIKDAGCLDSAVTTGAEAATLWRIREDGAGLSSRTPDGKPAWPGWEDAAVPPEKLPEYLPRFEALMGAHGLDGLIYGHFGDGCIHVRIDFPFRDRPKVFREFLAEAAKLAAEYGGSMSGEHGDGRARGELLGYMYSAEALAAFGEVKKIFDPAGLLNPGVIVSPAPVDADLRVPAARPVRDGLGFAYPHDDGDFTEAVHRCVGVGKCRASIGPVMCPSYQATKDEKDSTRGRARVLQEVTNGTLRWDSPEVADSLDLCLACKGCSSDCPAGVDMATYKSEALYQKYKRRIRPASHYSLGWLPRWARLASRVPWLANLTLAVGGGLAKRGAGVDSRRDLPVFAKQSFRRWFAAHLVAEGTPVMLWVDTFTDAFSPQVGIAAVKVLEDAGYSVRIPGRPVCCGLTWISTGQLDGARKQLRRSLDALGGEMPIVGLEPSCTAVLRSDAAELLPEASSLKSRVKTLAELLRDTQGWTPPDLTGVTGVAQPHCHQHAVLGWNADAVLLRSAGAEITAVDGCCGLAGNFGVERGHYEVSVAVAETHLLPAVRAKGPESVVMADGFSCRTQLEQLGDVRGTHLAELLASRLLAYGRLGTGQDRDPGGERGQLGLAPAERGGCLDIEPAALGVLPFQVLGPVGVRVVPRTADDRHRRSVGTGRRRRRPAHDELAKERVRIRVPVVRRGDRQDERATALDHPASRDLLDRVPGGLRSWVGDQPDRYLGDVAGLADGDRVGGGGAVGHDGYRDGDRGRRAHRRRSPGPQAPATAEQVPAADQVRFRVCRRPRGRQPVERPLENIPYIVHNLLLASRSLPRDSRSRAIPFAVWLLTVPSEQPRIRAVSATLKSAQYRSTTAARMPAVSLASAFRTSSPPAISGKSLRCRVPRAARPPVAHGASAAFSSHRYGR
jgi:FAD/FMN-containing dehydrogenase/Fe-S oxidoreductase